MRVVATVLMIATFGEAPTRRDLEELLAAGGLDVKNLAMDEIAKALQPAARDNLVAGLDVASRAELDQARDDCARANRVLTALGRAFGATSATAEHEMAARILYMLRLRRSMGDENLAHVMAQLDSLFHPATE